MEKVIYNIEQLSKITYVTVGVVLTEDNIKEFHETVMLAHRLGVSDIRIIPSAQWNEELKDIDIPKEVLNQHPILNYRVNNFKIGKHARGLTKNDNHRCPLVLDDMAVLNGLHFPCIIYLREQGNPIGCVSDNMRQERNLWALNHDTYSDKICRRNCLDVCIEYNNKHKYFRTF
jgi:hypothetical protein